VSEVSQGPGWWIASDGKWYPPELHPDRSGPPAEPEPEPEPESESEPESEPESVPPPSQSAPSSVSSPPPGARSSRWLGSGASAYPAPTGGPVEGPGEPVVPPTMYRPTALTPPTPPAAPRATAPLHAPAHARMSPIRATTRGGPWVLGLVLVGVTVVVLALVLVLVSVGGPSIAVGTDTATIHVKVPRSGSPSFSGTVAGKALTGTVTRRVTRTTPAGAGSISVDTVTFTCRGSLGGTPYVLHVSLVGDTDEPLEDTNVSFRVTGTYGSENVTAVAGYEEPTSITEPSQAVMLSGTIGHQLILGTATVTQDGAGSLDVTARMTALGNL